MCAMFAYRSFISANKLAFGEQTSTTYCRLLVLANRGSFKIMNIYTLPASQEEIRHLRQTQTCTLRSSVVIELGSTQFY